jgi:hypothetical protein
MVRGRFCDSHDVREKSWISSAHLLWHSELMLDGYLP